MKYLPMVFWMALFARGRDIFVPGAQASPRPSVGWSHVKHVEWRSKLEGNTSRVSKRTVRTTLFLFSVFIFCRHSSCRKDQFTVLFLKFGVEDFIDPGLLKIWAQLFKRWITLSTRWITIEWIVQSVFVILVHCIVIYPADSAIQLLNNWGLVDPHWFVILVLPSQAFLYTDTVFSL